MAGTTASTTKPSIVQRHKIVAFYGVPTTTGTGDNATTTIAYKRMKKFTQLSQSKNPIEYSRQYVDEPFSVNDVVGYAPSISYAFDKHKNLEVQTDIVKITNGEALGDDAVRSIVIVDTETNEAYQRDFSVVPNTEGDNVNVYTYSGTFKCKGELVKGTAATSDSFESVTFTAAT